MTAVPYSRFNRAFADHLIRNQRLFSPAQRRMAIDSPHLVWVNPRVRNLPKKLRRKIYDRQEGRCAYCDVALSFGECTIDHVVPIADGGGDEEANLTLACRPCNSSKGARRLG